MAYLVIWLTWIAWVPTVLLEKRSKGETPRTSIFPIVPLFPGLGSLAAWGLDALKPRLGSSLVGGGHAVLLALMLVSCAVYLVRIRRRRPQNPEN
ncbi:MAG: hypothetical protein HY302_14860 [Opitutae bacterium]|nr:hypothetical protein [Opitutae bacterium]